MRTEHDLHAALATREQLTPAAEAVLDGARQAAAGHRRRRAVTAGAVAAATAAVAAVIAVPALLAGGTTPEPLSPGAAPGEVPAAEPFDPTEPRPPYAFTIAADEVVGFEVRPLSVAPDHQIAEIRRPGNEEPAALLVVYDLGASPWVSVGEVILRWEYAPDGYAEITIAPDSPLDAETAQSLADSLQLVAPYPVRVPYRLDYLPVGMAPFNVVQDTATSGDFRSVAQLEGPVTLDITIAEGADVDDPSWDWRPTTIAGRPAECVDLIDGHRCRVEFADFTVNIGGGDRNQMDRIVAGLQPATWDDPATWYEVGDALPGQ